MWVMRRLDWRLEGGILDLMWTRLQIWGPSKIFEGRSKRIWSTNTQRKTIRNLLILSHAIARPQIESMQNISTLEYMANYLY